MAMTAEEKAALRTGLASEKTANILIAIIDGGSATALVQKTERVLEIALTSSELAANVIACFESGAAMSADAERAFKNMIGNDSLAESIITQIEAIT